MGGGRVRPRSGVGRRRGRCQTKVPLYDRGEGPRRWRGLDGGGAGCPRGGGTAGELPDQHGPTVVAVPWARHHAGHTYSFDGTVGSLAVACSKTAVCELMRIAWRARGDRGRVWEDGRQDRRAGLRTCAGSGSTRSSTSATTSTRQSWSTTLPAAWCGPPRAGQEDAAALFDALGAER